MMIKFNFSSVFPLNNFNNYPVISVMLVEGNTVNNIRGGNFVQYVQKSWQWCAKGTQSSLSSEL